MKQSWQRSDSDKKKLRWYIGVRRVKSVKYDGCFLSQCLSLAAVVYNTGGFPGVSGGVSRDASSLLSVMMG